MLRHLRAVFLRFWDGQVRILPFHSVFAKQRSDDEISTFFADEVFSYACVAPIRGEYPAPHTRPIPPHESR